MQKNTKPKSKKGRIVLALVLALLLAAALTCGLVLKSYMGRIRRVEEDPVDIIAPEDEFFDVDFPETVVVPEPQNPSDPEPETETPVQPAEPPETPDQPEEPEVETPVQPEPQPETPAQPEEPQVPPVQIDPGNVTWEDNRQIDDEYLINILLVGQDKPLNSTTRQRQRSDTMILCSINPETGEVSMISFLRDLYVQIPGGYSDNRLNATYVFGGFKLLDETLNLNFGVSVDHNFEVDMAGFQNIIDVLGGVEVELSAAEANALNKLGGSPVMAGRQTLMGNRALEFARLRSIDSDFGRTNRQREVLVAIFDKVKNLSAGELVSLLNSMLPYLTTDMTDAEILTLAYRLIPILPDLKISTYSVPANGTFSHANIRGMAVLLPNSAKIRDLLEQKYLPLD